VFVVIVVSCENCTGLGPPLLTAMVTVTCLWSTDVQL
jgi:hypothetical protein